MGMSLPLDYLIGRPSSEAAAILDEAFGRADSCLQQLRDRGVGSVELRGAGHGTDPDDALAGARAVWAAGMQITVHGSLPAELPGPTFRDDFAYLAGLAKAGRGRQANLTVAVH
ncbi:unnamed protein product, partial [marine sediment metagenome]